MNIITQVITTKAIILKSQKRKAAPGIEPGNNGFADRRLSLLAMPPSSSSLKIAQLYIECQGVFKVRSGNDRWASWGLAGESAPGDRDATRLRAIWMAA